LLIPFTVLVIHILIPLFHVKPDYLISLKYVGLISISFLFKVLSIMFNTPLYALKKTFLLPRIYGIAAVIQLIMSIILIKYFGLIGAVVSMILMKPIQALLSVWQIKKYFSFSYSIKKMIIMPLIYFVIFVGIEIISFRYSSVFLYWIELAVSAILVLFFFRNEIRTLAGDTLGKFRPVRRD
jgi:O-antigen/teichoic acid export membrane protein